MRSVVAKEDDEVRREEEKRIAVTQRRWTHLFSIVIDVACIRATTDLISDFVLYSFGIS